MKRILLYSLFLIPTLFACQNTEEENKSIQNKEAVETPSEEPQQQIQEMPEVENRTLTNADVAGIYDGELPCADCEVMDYRIELKLNGDYTERIYYVGKSKEAHETVGKYTFTEDNKIFLGKYNPGMNYLAKTKNGLLMLDIDGNVISGPLATKYALTRFQEVVPEDGKAINEQMWNKGVEFYASGNEPFWKLTLDLEKEIVFEAMGQPTIIVPPNEPELAQDADVLRIRSVNGNVELILTIASDPLCNDQMSSQAYDASVKVEVKKNNESDYQTWEGCGRYSIHPELFSQAWKLVSINDVAAEETKYQRGAPEITFRAFDRGFGGHDGCNEIGGRVSVRGDKLSFSSFASTALSCPDMTASREFNIAVQGETFSYVIFDELLTLTRFKSKLVFAKAD